MARIIQALQQDPAFLAAIEQHTGISTKPLTGAAPEAAGGMQEDAGKTHVTVAAAAAAAVSVGSQVGDL
jgi:hypothetical protein